MVDGLAVTTVHDVHCVASGSSNMNNATLLIRLVMLNWPRSVLYVSLGFVQMAIARPKNCGSGKMHVSNDAA